MSITPIELAQIEARLARNRRQPESGVSGEQSGHQSGWVDREGTLHRQIQGECEKRGWIALHGSMAHRAMRTVGEFDFVIVADQGRTFLVECKSKTGKLTVEQQAMHAHARHLGHKPETVRSLEEFLNAVNEKGKL